VEGHHSQIRTAGGEGDVSASDLNDDGRVYIVTAFVLGALT